MPGRRGGPGTLRLPMAAPTSPLKTSVEPLEGNKVRLRVGVPSVEFEKAIDAAFRKLAQEVRVPGFRPGKAPRRLLEARFGTEAAREQALRDSLPDFYAHAVEAEDIDVIAAPEIDITAGEEEGDVEFDAVVEVRPVVELAGYDDLQGRDPEPRGPRRGRRRADRRAARAVRRPRGLQRRRSSTADYAEIDIKGYVHDESIDGLTATDFLYEVGSGILVPELDEELRGKRAGDILKFNDVLAERFGERADQEVSFQVLVKEAKRKVLPEADDEWASEASEFDTIEELRGDVRRRLELVGKVQAQMALRDKVLEAVSGLVDIEIPEAAGRPGDGAPPPRPGPPPRAPGRHDPAVPRRHRPGPGDVRGRGPGGRRPPPSGPTSPCGPSWPKRRSRRPTKSSTPRSTGSPNGSARSPRRCAAISESGGHWRRYALIWPEARHCSSSSTTPRRSTRRATRSI